VSGSELWVRAGVIASKDVLTDLVSIPLILRIN